MWAEARSIHSDLDRHPGVAQQGVENVADAMRAPGADVVDATWDAPLHEQLVGMDGVADIGQVAPRVEVPDDDDRLGTPSFDLGDLMGKARRRVGQAWRGPKWLNERGRSTARPSSVTPRAPSIS